MNLQLTKAAAKSNLLLRGDLLVAEHQQTVIQMSLMDAFEIGVVQGLGQIKADDLGTQRRVEWPYRKTLRCSVCLQGGGNCRHK
jgi:hypothetical protein